MKHNGSHRNMSSGVAGLIIAGLGLALSGRFFYPENELHPSIFDMLIFCGPAFLISGCVVALRGIVCGKKGLDRSGIRWCGLVLLLFGGFPWVYTPLIIPDKGMEGSGMLGTILFVTMGLPGIAAILISLFLTD